MLGGLLAGAGLSALTACGGGDDDALPPGPSPEPTPTPDPDTGLIAEALAGKRDLLARYAATLARFPGLGAGLAPARADHEGHARALAASPLAPPEATAALSTPPAPGASASADPSASPGPTAPSVPAERGAAVRALAAAERAAAETRLSQCVAAGDAGLARLLASVGACEAAHALILGDLAEPAP